MVLKVLFLFIALSYVTASPINLNDAISDKPISTDNLTPVASNHVQASAESNLPHETPKVVVNADEEVHETRSARVARENKIEYVYVDSEGKMRQVVPKNVIKLNPLSNLNAEESEVVASPVQQPNLNGMRYMPSLETQNFLDNKVTLLGKNSEKNLEQSPKPTADDKLDSSSLQYASGSLKVRNENLKSRMTNVPQLSGQQQQSSPLISNLVPQSPFLPSIYPNDPNILQGYPGYNPLISPIYSPYNPSYSYPLNYPLLLQNLNNPLLTTSPVVQPDLLSRSVVSNLNPEGLEIRRPYHNLDLIPSFISNLPYLYQNRLISPTNLFGRTLNSLIYSPNLLYNSPYINPLIGYALPQQTPSLSYLLGRNASPIGLNGLSGYDYPYNSYNNYIAGYPYSNINSPYLPSSVYPNLVNNLLYPGLAQNYYPSLYPQYLPQAAIGSPILNYPYYNQPLYNQPLYNQPLYNQPQSSILPQPLVQPQVALNPQDSSAFSSRRVSTTTTISSPTTTTVSNSPTSSETVLPFSDSVVSSSVPSVVIPGDTASTVETNEKPLLYSNNQNAALRSPYHTGYYPESYNSQYYSRLIDPLTGLPYYRYPSNGYYSRLSGYYGPNYSSIYRPGYIGTYPPGYGLNGLNGLNGYGNGILPYSSMHYSALDPSEVMNRSGKNDEKVKETSKDQSKESNLMYTIKTSKSESKETLSRLNSEDTPKLGLDKKA